MRRRLRPGALAAALLLAAAPPAAAQAPDPVAVVEEISDPSVGIEPFEFLLEGRVIALSAGTVAVIGYLQSCVRETVTAGTILVGERQSQVSGGTVEREKVQCDGGRLILTRAQARASGVVAFRDTAQSLFPKPEVTLYGTTPAIELPGPGHLVIERLDRRAPRLEIDVTAADLVHGRMCDLAGRGWRLAPGGIYAAEFGGRRLTFQIAPSALDGTTALIGRLLAL
ncbi:MAG: hypothetical protein AB7K86_12005 [Rhodospirillales bacterium]